MARPIAVLLVLLIVAACDRSATDDRLVGRTASDRIELAADANEPIVEILVAEGAEVSSGQPLLRQDPLRAQARLEQAGATTAEAEARLAELVRGPRSEQIDVARANVAGAEEQLTLRQAEWKRVSEVYGRNLISAQARDQALANLDTARANLALYRAQLEEALAGTTVEELDQAEAAVASAQAAQRSAQIDIDKLTLYAPVNGVMDTRLFETGERPVSGQPVLVMLGGTQAYVRIYVTEDKRITVGPGTRARIHVDGLDEVLDGRVRWVSSDAAFTPYFALTERDRGRLTYEAKVDILGRSERLPDGVPVQVELLPGAQQ